MATDFKFKTGYIIFRCTSPGYFDTVAKQIDYFEIQWKVYGQISNYLHACNFKLCSISYRSLKQKGCHFVIIIDRFWRAGLACNLITGEISTENINLRPDAKDKLTKADKRVRGPIWGFASRGVSYSSKEVSGSTLGMVLIPKNLMTTFPVRRCSSYTKYSITTVDAVQKE